MEKSSASKLKGKAITEKEIAVEITPASFLACSNALIRRADTKNHASLIQLTHDLLMNALNSSNQSETLLRGLEQIANKVAEIRQGK